LTWINISAKMKLEYFCPFCKHDAEISCEYESPSDYYIEGYECINCGKELDHNIIDQLAFDGVGDDMGNQIERAEMYYSDR